MAIAHDKKNSSSEPQIGRPKDVEKEAAILGAAAILFMERGFTGASIEAIAKKADVSKVTIYSHFGDKEALFRAMLTWKCESLMSPALFGDHPTRGLRAALKDIGRQFLALILSPEPVQLNRVMVGVFGHDIRMSELFFESAVGSVKDRVASFFAKEVERGRLRKMDCDSAAWRFLAAVKGEAHMRALLGLPLPSDAFLDSHVDACVDDFLRANATKK